MKRQEIERARAILRRWGDCDALIRFQCRRMSEARASIEAMRMAYRPPVLDGMPHSPAGPAKPTERAVERMEDCARAFERVVERCTAVIRELNAFKAAVSGLVYVLPRHEREVIVRVYHDHMDMVAAATLAGVSERTGYNWEMSAIERMGAGLIACGEKEMED